MSHPETIETVAKSATGYTRLRALLDLMVAVAVLVVVKQSLLPITQLYAGPVSTLSAMIVGTILLRRRGLSWSDLGFRWPESWIKTLGLTLLTMAFFLVCTQLIALVADQFFEDIGTSDRFSHIEGNLTAYLIIMPLILAHGAFNTFGQTFRYLGIED